MTDDELLDLVRTAFESYDPVPADVRRAARDAFALRTPGAVVLPRADRPEPAAVRGDGTRMIRFAGPDLAVEAEVTRSGGLREIAGRLVPPAPAHIRVRHAGGERTGRADAAGLFAVTVPAGPVSLLFLLPTGTTIVTSWVRL